jgi:hypothetical protein
MNYLNERRSIDSTLIKAGQHATDPLVHVKVAFLQAFKVYSNFTFHLVERFGIRTKNECDVLVLIWSKVMIIEK